MNFPHRLLLSAAFCALLPLLHADTAPNESKRSIDVAAVFSAVAPDYQRILRDDGRPTPETYAFGEGEFSNDRISDRSLDDMSFKNIARALVPALATQNCAVSQDPAKTDLLIMVHWGMAGVENYGLGYGLPPSAPMIGSDGGVRPMGLGGDP